MHNLGERYKTYTNTALLEIIGNPGDYQVQAVDAAKAVLSERELSEVELNLADTAFNVQTEVEEISGEEPDYAEGFEGMMQMVSRKTIIALAAEQGSLPLTD